MTIFYLDGSINCSEGGEGRRPHKPPYYYRLLSLFSCSQLAALAALAAAIKPKEGQ
jgi:hypothetical protein